MNKAQARAFCDFMDQTFKKPLGKKYYETFQRSFVAGWESGKKRTKKKLAKQTGYAKL